ncbi:MAG: GTP 3',8-cyclase MoaA [Alphaproteobacteria bacterium]|nr:GTP 3',8-cyclase MoaA [Alphaproteobacteria bacterium]
MPQEARPLVDSFGRAITYLRVSVTDRCDLRCTYCMPERMTFLPKPDVLTFEELDAICTAFIARGVRRLRLTGGEPLGRRGLLGFVEGLSRHLRSGALEEMTLTTNGVALARHAEALFAAGVRRVNVSLDTLDPAVFARITRRNKLPEVLAGIEAARAAGLAVKINTVALAQDNADELPRLIQWAHGQGMDITLIEAMPMGDVDADRPEQHLSLKDVRATLTSFWTLTDTDDRTGGPARYVRVRETGGRIGFITPLSHNFCESCNRVRLTCTGMLYTCLGREDRMDLRAVLRAGGGAPAVHAAIDAALAAKPAGHDFRIERLATPASPRQMSVTGG